MLLILLQMVVFAWCAPPRCDPSVRGKSCFDPSLPCEHTNTCIPTCCMTCTCNYVQILLTYGKCTSATSKKVIELVLYLHACQIVLILQTKLCFIIIIIEMCNAVKTVDGLILCGQSGIQESIPSSILSTTLKHLENPVCHLVSATVSADDLLLSCRTVQTNSTRKT